MGWGGLFHGSTEVRSTWDIRTVSREEVRIWAETAKPHTVASAWVYWQGARLVHHKQFLPKKNDAGHGSSKNRMAQYQKDKQNLQIPTGPKIRPITTGVYPGLRLFHHLRYQLRGCAYFWPLHLEIPACMGPLSKTGFSLHRTARWTSCGRAGC